VPLDVYRKGEKFIVRVDLPGIDPASLDLTIERNVLSIKAERSWVPSEGDEVLVVERPREHSPVDSSSARAWTPTT